MSDQFKEGGTIETKTGKPQRGGRGRGRGGINFNTPSPEPLIGKKRARPPAGTVSTHTFLMQMLIMFVILVQLQY